MASAHHPSHSWAQDFRLRFFAKIPVRISVTIPAKFLVWRPRRNFCQDPCKGPSPRFSPRSPQDSCQEVSHCFSRLPRFGPVYHDKGPPPRFSPRSPRDSRQEVSHCFSPYPRFGPVNHDFFIYLTGGDFALFLSFFFFFCETQRAKVSSVMKGLLCIIDM